MRPLTLACALLLGCSSSGDHDAGTDDFAMTSHDMSGVVDASDDLTGADLEMVDAVAPPDLALPTGWVAVDDGLHTAYVLAIAIHPLDALLVYIATENGGVWKSIDGGAHWSNVNAALPEGTCYSIAVDPKNENVVYAGTAYDGVWKSSDGGTTWAQLVGGVTVGQYVYGVVVDGSGNVWAGSQYGDGVDEWTGTAWATQSTGLPTTPIAKLVIDSAGTLWAATEVGVAKFGGGTWTTIDSGLPAMPNVTELAVDPTNPLNAYLATSTGAFYATTTGGMSWSVAGAGLSAGIESIAVDPKTPTNVYVGQNSNVYVSTSSGAMFAAAGMGVSTGGSGVPSLAVDANGVVYAGTYGGGTGMYKSTDSGTTWTGIATGLTNGAAGVLATDPEKPQALYVASSHALYVSANGGASFTAENVSYGYGIVVDPFSSAHVLVATAFGVEASSDSGQTWTTVLANSVDAIAADPKTNGTFYAGSSNNFYVSTDHGVTFNPSTNGLPTNPYVTGIAVDPLTSNVYVAVFQKGLYRSTNGGMSFSQADTATLDSGALFTDGKVFLSGEINDDVGFNIRRSTNGTTWTAIQVSTLSGDGVSSFTEDSTGAFYVGTKGKGVYRSADGGLTWTAATHGLNGWDVNGLGSTTEDGVVKVWATTGDGLYVTYNGGQ